MNRLLAIMCFLMGLAVVIFAFPEGNVAALILVISTFVVIFIINKQSLDDKPFLVQIFLTALFLRVGFGLILHIFDLRLFFGGDANTYDYFGNEAMKMWFDLPFRESTDAVINRKLSQVGWGMYYLVGGLYSIVGQNILAAQFFCAVIGAAIAPMIYSCSYRIFNNRRVGQVAAILVAVSPSFILWTGQLLKDGLIIFLLVVAMTMVLNLQKKFDFVSLSILLASLFGIISLRFYVFYMVAAAVVGTFVIGFSNSPKIIARRMILLVLLGVAATYIGAFTNAGNDLGTMTNLERVQVSREDLARAESGYGQDIDISTTAGAIQVIPIGFIYLMLAPFPWQLTNFRQLITIPDMLLWWSLVPFIISGIVFSIKNRLRGSMGILIFSLMLSLAYSIFQGNVGTAYRQRTQIQVFFFIFAGVGWTLILERMENKKALRIAKRRAIENKLRLNKINKDREEEEENK